MNRLALVALALLAGCTHAPPKPDVVWPPPPDTARIRFVTAFRQAEDMDTSGSAALKRALLGRSNDPGLAMPMSAAISDDGQRLYIGDHGASHVFVANFADKSLKLFAPDEPMGKPFGVALDGDENVYVTDSPGAAVRVFSKDGRQLRVFGGKELERPTGIAIDRTRKLVYVADTGKLKSEAHRVRVFDLEGAYLRDLGTGKKGDGDGDLYFPAYLALDKEGNVYVGDTMNFRIQVFGPDGRFVRKYGENGDGPGSFSRIKGLAFDGFGNLYVVDGGHSNVQLFNQDFQALMFFGGYAQKVEYFDVPSGIAIDPKTNRIYVCNEFVSRVNVYELINTTADDSRDTPAKDTGTKAAAAP